MTGMNNKMLVQDGRVKTISKLRDYFVQREEVLMAFLFGSWARNQEGFESDLDMAVYFKPKTDILEWQTDSYYLNFASK